VLPGADAGGLDGAWVDGPPPLGGPEPPGVVAGPLVAGLPLGDWRPLLPPDGVAVADWPGVAVPVGGPPAGVKPAGLDAGLEAFAAGCDVRPSGLPRVADGEGDGLALPWPADRSPPLTSRTTITTAAITAAPTTTVTVRRLIRRGGGVRPPGALTGTDSRSGTRHSSE
jgi:hypothetical protein